MSTRSRQLVAALVIIAASSVGLVAAFAANPGPVPAPPKPHPGATILPGGRSAQWQPIFDEEFKGSSLDTSIWSTCYYWDCTNRANNELEWFLPSQVTVDRGVLSLTATPQQIDGKQYASGMISSYGHFSFTYGYAQIVAKLPTGQGLWSAFWMLPEAGGWPPEVDVFENWAQATSVNFVVHFGANQRAYSTIHLPTFDTQYHTYAVDWEPGSFTWYVDGVKQVHFAIPVPQAMYLISTLNIDGGIPPNAAVHFPQSLKVKSIKVWQRPGVGSYSLNP